MKFFAAILATGICLACSVRSQAQQPLSTADSLQKVQADAVQRSLLKDSLGLSEQVVSQVLTIRDSRTQREATLRSNASLSNAQLNAALRDLRSTIVSEMKQAMGEANYERYLDLIVGTKPE